MQALLIKQACQPLQQPCSSMMADSRRRLERSLYLEGNNERTRFKTGIVTWLHSTLPYALRFMEGQIPLCLPA